MKAMDMKQKSGAVTLLLSAVGALEELARLRPSMAHQSLLQFRLLKASKIEAELLAPGRDFALLYDAERTFGPP